MKIKLTRKLGGIYQGDIGEVIDVDEKHVDAIIRQSAGYVINEPKPDKPKEEKKKAQ